MITLRLFDSGREVCRTNRHACADVAIMAGAADHLPDDTAALKAALIETRAKLVGAETMIEHLQLVIAEMKNDFAKGVLGEGYTAAAAAQLKSKFGAWVKQFGEFMDASLPRSAWGPGRLDAFGMIFNRVAARDLGMTGNFKVADAPASYPFLWNASRQDRTQWNGGVHNGLYVQALARNTGEAFGVFADFKPTIVLPGTLLSPTLIDFRSNSADFAGLQTLEEKIAALKPPPWPGDVFGLDDELAQKGKPLFDDHCGECHAEKTSPLLSRTWVTPIVAAGHRLEDGAQRRPYVQSRGLRRRAFAAAADRRQV